MEYKKTNKNRYYWKFIKSLVLFALLVAAFPLIKNEALFADSCPLCLCDPKNPICPQKREKKSCVFPDRRSKWINGKKIKFKKVRSKKENPMVRVNYITPENITVSFLIQKFMFSNQNHGAPLTEAFSELANETCKNEFSKSEIINLYAFETAIRKGSIQGNSEINFELVRIPKLEDPDDSKLIRNQDKQYFPFEEAMKKVLVFDWRRGIYIEKEDIFSSINTGFRCMEELIEQ